MYLLDLSVNKVNLVFLHFMMLQADQCGAKRYFLKVDEVLCRIDEM